MEKLVFGVNLVAAVMWAVVALTDNVAGGAITAGVLAAMHTIICINVVGDLF